MIINKDDAKNIESKLKDKLVNEDSVSIKNHKNIIGSNGFSLPKDIFNKENINSNNLKLKPTKVLNELNDIDKIRKRNIKSKFKKLKEKKDKLL